MHTHILSEQLYNYLLFVNTTGNKFVIVKNPNLRVLSSRPEA